ncbi:thiamine transporter 1 [Drosophila sulfurigaster albostrigata]|uniref:thiamine transporter 1 n=1 Tax=Drosophila sulfurigaster albostrigata TaxID=89887 RepID=UPI002D21E9FF|nr:thiamine transporter 1 [Drosophila sulfurigaster albostrigata]
MNVLGVTLVMESSWLKVSCLLCVFGFLRELRPSEPYHAEILLGEWYNVTQDQVNRSVYPVGTYSYLALLIVVFLVTDFLRYKPLIIANALTGIVIWSVLIWTTTLLGLQIVEVFYGFYQATEVAYYSYIYAKVDKQYYPRVTSHTRAAMFVGKLVAGLSAQLLISLDWMNYKQLLYISAGSQVFALMWAFGLPKVKKSVYFHHKPDTIAIQHGTSSNVERLGPVALLWSHFRSAYSNPMVLQWSLWYAIALAGYLQVTTYMQVVWKSFEDEPTIVWNGGVDAALTALAALSTLLAGYLHAGRLKSRASLLTLSVLSVLEGGCVLLAAWPKNIYISYLGYVLFGAIYGFTITVASAELASSLLEDSFALIFGINTLVALALQSLLTLVFVSEGTGLNLNTFEQFTVYAFYFIIFGIVYFIAVIVEFLLRLAKVSKTQVMEIE